MTIDPVEHDDPINIRDEEDVIITSESPMPTEIGWYQYSGPDNAGHFAFHLRFDGEKNDLQWRVYYSENSGETVSEDDCVWGYIEQALGVWDLVKVDKPSFGVPEPV